ncbi:MAG: hypothetical protein LBR34_04550 [Prevotella sp.]|jgi:hypothetical protein|nr:hypothetical protein [Prevotella sp.]
MNLLPSPVLYGMGEVPENGEYQGYTPLPTTQLPSDASMSAIQEMGGIGEGYERELRDKPGGGPGLGEIQVALNSQLSNVLGLVFSSAAIVAAKEYRKRKKKKDKA